MHGSRTAAVGITGWRGLLRVCVVWLTMSSSGAMTEPAMALTPDLKDNLLTLSHLAGEPLTKSDLSSKATVVSFFARWCPPCHAEFYHLAEFREHYSEDVTILSINVFENYGAFKDSGIIGCLTAAAIVKV